MIPLQSLCVGSKGPVSSQQVAAATNGFALGLPYVSDASEVDDTQARNKPKEVSQ